MSSKPIVELTEADRRNVEHACAALSVEYCEWVDAKEYDRLRDVFVADALFVSPAAPEKEIRGADAIVSYLSAIPRALGTQHLAFNVRVHVESSDAAAGSCRLVVFMADANEPETPEGRKLAAKQLIGIYRDRYVRTPAGWRIAERRGQTLFHT